VRFGGIRQVGGTATGLSLVVLAVAAPARGTAAPRVFSLDQCADQYVLALTPPAAIAGLSPRARAADSYLRAQVGPAPIRRPSTEAILAANPEVVVRSWGGGYGVERALKRRGIAVVQLGDADDFPAVRRELGRAATALGARAKGEALAAAMDRRLEAARGAWGGRRGLYLTPAAFTAGPGTLVDAMLRAAGLANAAVHRGYAPVPLERLVLAPPSVLVLGFFESAPAWRWSPGRHPALRRLAARKAVAALPGSVLGCPGWFAADGVTAIAAAARGRSR
jgi:iron complex transport system substrate-binding protein